jgi:iron complex outermembrane recepter protein
LGVYVGKRNVEGGPRISDIESNSFRIVAGVEGDITGRLGDTTSPIMYGRNSSNEANKQRLPD